MSEIRLLIEAADFAARLHRDQRRKDAEASPYINHPIAVAHVLASHGVSQDVELLCAALLHDLFEDTDCSAGEMEERFGLRVTSIVQELTNDKSIPKDQVKQRQIEKAPKMSRDAKLVKLADRICNLTDILETPPFEWSFEKKRAYFESSVLLVDGLRGAHPELEAKAEELLGRSSEIC